MKNIAVLIAVIVVGFVVYLLTTSEGEVKNANGYNKTTNITIDGVPFDKAKNDASGDVPPPPPVITR